MKMGISSGITRSPSRPKGGEPTCRDPPNGLPHITYIGFQTGQFLEGPGILILFYFFFVCVCVWCYEAPQKPIDQRQLMLLLL